MGTPSTMLHPWLTNARWAHAAHTGTPLAYLVLAARGTAFLAYTGLKQLKRQLLVGHHPQRTSQTAAKTHPQSSCENRPIHLPWNRFRFTTHLEATKVLSGSLGWEMPSLCSSWALQGIPASPRKELTHFSRASAFAIVTKGLPSHHRLE